MLLVWVAVSAVLIGLVAALLTKGTVVLTSRLGGERVSRTLAAAEYVVEHHAVPPDWRAKLQRRLPGLRPGGAEPRGQARHRNLARRWCLRELGRLVAFSRTTSIVTDGEAREMLLSELLRVREEWQGRSWEEMCRSDGASARHPV